MDNNKPNLVEESQLNEARTLEQLPAYSDPVIKDFQPTPEIQRIAGVIQNKSRASMASPSLKYGYGDIGDFNKEYKQDKLPTKVFDIGKEAYIELNSGKLIPRFEKYLPGINNEEILAQQQTTGEKWSRGLQKLGGKIGVNVLGGTIGIVEGVINGIKEGSFNATWNSPFNQYLDDLNKKLDYNLANYYTEQEKQMNFGQKLTTSNFWANDFLGGVSFLAGTIISEGLWAAATGGTSVIAKGIAGGYTRALSRALGKGSHKALSESKKIGNAMIRAGEKEALDNLGKGIIKSQRLSKLANEARFFYTSAGFEAGVEARHFMDEALTEWEDVFYNENGREPNTQEKVKFEQELVNSGNGLFAGNVALVGTSNFITLGNLLLGKTATKQMSNSLFKKYVLGAGYKATPGKALEALSPTKFQKVVGKAYSIGKPMFTEGFIEEGGQAVMSTAASEYVLSGYKKENLKDGFTLIDGLIEGFKYAYTTKEGLTEVGLGSLIGVLGGGFNTGFKFNEASQTVKDFQNKVTYINQFALNNVIENIKYNAKVNEASQQSKQAREKGDIVGESRADATQMIALIERAKMYQDTNEVNKNFITAIDAMESATLEKELGMTSEEVSQWKADKKVQFLELSETHSNSMEIADAIMAAPIAGINSIGLTEQGITDLKSAIAYSFTMGKFSDDFASTLANQIKLTIAKDFLQLDDVQALEVHEVIRKVSEAKLADYNTKTTRLNKIQNELEKVEKALVEIQNLPDKEDNQARANKLNSLTLKLTKLQEEASKLQQEKTVAFEALSLSQFTEDVITEEMLDNQSEAIKRLDKTIDNISEKDPKKALELKSLMEQYDSAIKQAKNFSTLVQSLASGSMRAATLNGWISSIINTKKKLGKDNAEIIRNVIADYTQDLSVSKKLSNEIEAVNEVINEAVKAKTNKQENPLNNPPEDISEGVLTEAEIKAWRDSGQVSEQTINKIVDKYVSNIQLGKNAEEGFTNAEKEIFTGETTRVNEQIRKRKANQKSTPQSVVDKLKAKLKEIIQNNPYTNLKYDSNQPIELNQVRPEQTDIDRYQELLAKIIPGKNVNVILKRPFKKGRNNGLTKEETEELQALNNKLNNWKTLQGVNENGDSVAELLQLIDQYQKKYNLRPTKVEVQPEEFIKVNSATQSKTTKSNDNLGTIITPDIAVAKKDQDTNTYQISHIKPNTLLSLFPNSALRVLVGKRKVNVQSLPKAKQTELSTQEGTEYTLTLENGSELIFTVGNRQRLNVDIEALNGALAGSDIRILDFGNSNFMPLFKKVGDKFIPLQGDYSVDTVSDNEVIILDPQRLYDIKEGEVLKTVVNLNDSYNAQLLEDFKAGKITEEELINNIHIYLVPQGAVNEIVGSMRAISPNSNPSTPTFQKLHLVRKQAVRKALKSKTNRVDVGVTVELSMSLMGSPNLTVTENAQGELQATNNDLTPEQLEVVSDYGYMLNGELFTKNNLDYSPKETIFAREVGNRPESKDKKIPVIVFKYKSKTIVFPVTLNQNPSTKLEKVKAIVQNTQDSEAAMLIKLNELLIENNIDPTLYDFETPGDFERLMQDLENMPEVVDLETWLDKDHDKNTLLGQVKVAINLTESPFNAPKGILNFDSLDTPTEQDMEIEQVNILNDLAIKVNRRFAEDNPFANMINNSQFYDEFEQEGIDKNAESYVMKRRNANILTRAFSVKIPKEVRRVLGEQFITEIKSEISQFKILSEGLSTNTNSLDTKFKEELEELKNNCS